MSLGGQVGASDSPGETEPTIEVTVTKLDVNDPVLVVKKTNSLEKIYNIRGAESIVRNNGTNGLMLSFAYEIIGDGNFYADKPVQLVCGKNIAKLKVSYPNWRDLQKTVLNPKQYNKVKVDQLFINSTTVSEKRNFGRALCYFIEAYIPRLSKLDNEFSRALRTVNNPVTTLVRKTKGIAAADESWIDDSYISLFYKKHSTYIFWAIQEILEEGKIKDEQVLLGIWEYLLEYEQHYGYDGTGGNVSDVANKAIYNGWFGYKNQAQTILVPIFQKLADALPLEIVQEFTKTKKQGMDSYALSQFLGLPANAKYMPQTLVPTTSRA